ncbi:hypothetical protein CPLU01_08277 [Colletotrichum plurivorum]|uniref:Uncharacterized protein n=1 Tax=Colletotrichum plurivorum TaxID=2175906 RepID=A0A8H6KCB3_9PEZI|nr:hypothetical protein CPLU01_08277 [Colletotrichum plurivorum]
MVHTVLTARNGEFVVDQPTPPVPDNGTTKPWEPPFAIPIQGGYLDQETTRTLDTVFSDASGTLISGDYLDDFSKIVVKALGSYLVRNFGDPDSEDCILEERRRIVSFTSAQLVSMENRLNVGQDSNTAAFPADWLPPMQAVIIDNSRRRLVQSRPVTYAIIGILGFVVILNFLDAGLQYFPAFRKALTILPARY